jgi:hypothetical protein
VGEIELRVLACVAPAGDDTAGIAQRLGQPPETIRTALLGLVQAGFVEATGDAVVLTETGRLAAAHIRKSWPTPVADGQVSTIDVRQVAPFIGLLWSAHAERAAAEESARAEMLASDTDRDTVVQQLSDAFAQGRLSSSELESRTGRALSARTYGELDDVLQGLGGLQRPARRHPVRKAVFWVIALLFSPFVLVGTLFLAFGEDVGDHVFGAVFLLLLLPGLFTLRRWAWPRG